MIYPTLTRYVCLHFVRLLNNIVFIAVLITIHYDLDNSCDRIFRTNTERILFV